MCLLEFLQNIQNSTNCMVCSQFNEFIFPAYHNDKCDRCIQMRLYSMNKAEISFAYAIFIVFVLLAVIIGISGPPIENTVLYNFTDSIAHYKSKLMSLEKGGPFVFNTPSFTRYNRQLWLFATLYTENIDDEIYAENIQISTAIVQPHVLKEIVNHFENQSDDKLKINKNYTSLMVNYEDNVFRRRSRLLQCTKRKCKPLLIAHLGFIKFMQYGIIIKFHNLQNFYRKYGLKQITFTFRSYSTEFTQMELFFRTVYVIMTAFIMFWFGNTLSKYPIYDWTYEQKWLMLLLLLLFFFNGPVYSCRLLLDHWIVELIDNLFQITFLACLALFNVCVFRAFGQIERRFVSFYMEKTILVFFLWMLSMIMTYCRVVWEFLDFSYDITLDWKAYQPIMRWWLFFAALYFVYLFVSLLRACTALRVTFYFDKRSKFAVFNVVVMALIWYFSWSYKYGMIGTAEDFYVAYAAENKQHCTSAAFMVVYTCLNFYIYLMAYIYFPSQKSFFGNVALKDNPSLSMMNNSEDEDRMAITPIILGGHSTKVFLNSSDEDNNDLYRSNTDTSNNVNIRNQNDDSD